MAIPFLYWMLLLSVGLLALIALAFALNAHRRLAASEKKYQSLVELLRREVEVLASSSIGMGQRLQTMEGKLSQTMEKQQTLENRDPDALAYNQAAKLMEMGADVDDLVANCGIARPEAELMALLHREIKASPALEPSK